MLSFHSPFQTKCLPRQTQYLFHLCTLVLSIVADTWQVLKWMLVGLSCWPKREKGHEEDVAIMDFVIKVGPQRYWVTDLCFSMWWPELVLGEKLNGEGEKMESWAQEHGVTKRLRNQEPEEVSHMRLERIFWDRWMGKHLVLTWKPLC